MNRAVPTMTESVDEWTTLLKAEQNVTRAQRQQISKDMAPAPLALLPCVRLLIYPKQAASGQ